MSNAVIFVDTFHWIAEINVRDEWHNQCKAARLALRDRPLVTSEEVLSEVLDFLSGFGPLMGSAAALTVSAILQDAEVQVIPQSHETFLGALEFYRARPDKRYSLTDCSSMALMSEHEIRNLLTHDHHFTQVGFRTLIE
jgi:predicted nucleic acid-binding protein